MLGKRGHKLVVGKMVLSGTWAKLSSNGNVLGKEDDVGLVTLSNIFASVSFSKSVDSDSLGEG